MRRPIVAVVSLLVVLSGCTSQTPPGPKQPTDSPETAAAALAAGLAAKDLSKVEFAGAASDQVNDGFRAVVRGMGPLKPTVTPADVSRTGEEATVALSFSWTFPGVPQQWTYQTQAHLRLDGGKWKPSWLPSVVHPQLDGGNRLSQRRLAPDRGELLGEGGRAIVESRMVYRIGIDNAAIKPAQRSSSAKRLARLLRINPEQYARQVGRSGPEAFVEAIVLRADAKDLPLARTIRAIPGGTSIQDQRMLAPTRDFARPVIGAVGSATKEVVDSSGGTVVAGDQVGLSGLQKRYESQLRGTPGVEVRLVPGQPKPEPASPSPSPTQATPSPGATPAPATLFSVKPTAGTPLATTLQPTLQRLAERTLAKAGSAASMVVIRPSTGAVLVAADNARTKGQPLSTVGRAAPGSTFKVVSALALLRAGVKPESPVSCPARLTVDGKRFKNYSDYPVGQLGAIDLRTALAQSCNTAFIGQRAKVKDGALADAAGSLGFGIDYDVGYASFFGSVPKESTATGRAASLIGQARIEASPLAMAAVVASVAAGHTVVPHLVDAAKPASKGKPLTGPEARQLRSMMRGVVTSGSGRVLSGLSGGPVIAKTGTAEYGSKPPYPTHAWMIAEQDDLAVAVFVDKGQSGSKTAGPLIREFLTRAR